MADVIFKAKLDIDTHNGSAVVGVDRLGNVSVDATRADMTDGSGCLNNWLDDRLDNPTYYASATGT